MVASLLDKAPNLAGLSRTCEVTYTPYFMPILALVIWGPHMTVLCTEPGQKGMPQ